MTRSRKEAEAAGVKVSETKHHMKRRSPWHDYRERGTYMLTLIVEGRKPLLGRLVVEERKLGKSEKMVVEERKMVTDPNEELHITKTARVELTALGKAIRDEEIRKIEEHYSMVEVWKLCIMPDHIHMIVRVKDNLPEGKHLGQVIWGFKVGCTKAWWRLMPSEKPLGTETAPVPAGSPAAPVPAASSSSIVPAASSSAPVPAGSPAGKNPSLFEPGYNDKILLREGQLSNWKRYLDDNPRRLAIKRLHPDFFTVIHQAIIVGRKCQMVGNRFLLDIPQKMAVIVHSAYTDEEYADWRRKWLACGEAGGVLISAAIAAREKEVMREAMDRGYNIILLRENGFPPLYKPSGESFTVCSEGRLLQISPWEFHMERKTISREQCLILNRMAEEIQDIHE